MSEAAQQAAFLAVCIEISELRRQLAEVQDQCIELAVDAGAMHAENAALRAELAETRVDRDAWRSQGTRRNHG